MSDGGITEGIVEDAALEYFRALGYATLAGPTLAPDGPAPERSSYDQVVLIERLREAATRINGDVSPATIDQAVKQVLRAESQNALVENERVHGLITRGVPVEHRGRDGVTRTVLISLVDWDDPDANDWLAVNQFTVVEEQEPPARRRRVRQRPAAWALRAEEPGRRERDAEGRLEPGPDLPHGHPWRSSRQRRLRHL